VEAVRQWVRHHSSLFGSSKESDHVWVASLEMDWLGSLPLALQQLGQGRGSVNPTFRYPPGFIGTGCVSATGGSSSNSSSSIGTSADLAMGEKKATTARSVVGGTAMALLRRFISAIERWSPFRLLRWVFRRLVLRAAPLVEEPLNTDRDYCYPDLWRVSGRLLAELPEPSSVFSPDAEPAVSVARLFNAARSQGSNVQDASSYGLEAGLLSPKAFARPTCYAVGASSDGIRPVTSSCVRGSITRVEWTAAKEQFRAGVVVYAPAGVLFRDTDRHDFELQVTW